jgi:acyl-CoA synthetase (NDP forming)
MKSSDHHFLHKFFYPESVAIVGASRNPLRPNYHLVANLVKLGFQGSVYPVNPEAGDILGLKAYPSVKSINGPVDLAVVAVSYQTTPGLLKDCIEKGIKRVVLVAGGFSETGEEGRKVQKEMATLLKENGVRAIGPNALSPINPSINFAICFHPVHKMKSGGLSLIFQSGLYEPRLEWLFSDFNLHLNKLIDLGNKMDINEVDALTYLVRDPQTRVIGIHLESIEGDGREFLRLIREASRDKHVVVLKSGRTEAGAKAAASHTGVIVQGNDLVFDAALKQAGAIRAQTIEEFFDLAKGLERLGPLLLPGNRVVVATLPGGEAVIITDLCQHEGLSLAELQEDTLNRLRPIFPPWKISGNPFDLGVSLQFNDPRKVYPTLVEALVRDPNVDALAIQIPSRAFKIPREFFQVFPQSLHAKKPIALWVAGISSGGHESLEWLEDQYVPVFPTPEKVIKTLAALHRSSLFKLPRPKEPGGVSY